VARAIRRIEAEVPERARDGVSGVIAGDKER
jgi:hypothetical protein